MLMDLIDELLGEGLDWMVAHRVAVSGSEFEWRLVMCGVPQGWVLFNIFADNRDSGIKSTLRNFADDTSPLWLPLPGSVQGRVGWGFEQPGVLESVHGHGRN